MRRIATVALIAMLLGLGMSWGFGSLMVRPAASDVPPAIPPARDIEMIAADGVRIAATWWPGRSAAAPAILLLHGNGASRALMAEKGRWLSGQGYAVLAIDFRGHGESQQEARSFGLRESRDAAAAFAWLKARNGGGRIAVLGISLGGAAALLGEEGPLPADALVLHAVYPDIRHAVRNRIASIAGPLAWAAEPLLSYQSLPRWGVWPGGLSPRAALARYRGPVFVIGGAEDRYTPRGETRSIYEAVHGPRMLWIVPGLDHAAVSGIDGEEYRRRLLGFLVRTIGRP